MERSRLLPLAVVSALACDRSRPAEPPPEPSPVASIVAIETPTPVPTPVWLWEEKGDLDALRARGTMRVLMPRQFEGDWLPRKGFPLDFEREAAAAFAKENGLEVAWVYVDSHEDLVPWLLEGKGT